MIGFFTFKIYQFFKFHLKAKLKSILYISLENNLLLEIFLNKNFKYLKIKTYNSKNQEPRKSRIKKLSERKQIKSSIGIKKFSSAI